MMASMMAGILMLMAADDGGETNADVASIPEHRRGAWTLRFCLQSGEPLANRPVEVQLIAHDFLVGTMALPNDGEAVDAWKDGVCSGRNLVALPRGLDEGQMDALVVGAEMRGYTVMASCPPGLVDESGVRAAMGRYAGHVKVWEVIVDPVGTGMSAGEVVALFEVARGLDPDARLLMAQSGIELPGRAERFAAFVEGCVRAGADVDGVSVEGPPKGGWAGAEALWGVVERLAETGVPVLLKGVPAGNGGDGLRRCFATAGVMGVVLGGRWDRLVGSLGSDGSDGEDSMIAGMACDQWMTRASLRTDGDGTASFEGMFGDYEIVLDGHVWKAPFRGDTPGTVEFRKPPTVEPPSAFVNPFRATSEAEVRAWQEEIRARLLEIVSAQNPRQEHALDVEKGEGVDHGAYAARDLLFTGNEGQRIETTLTRPKGEGPFPAMVCLHGHGGDRFKVHDASTEFNALATEFARRGFVTIAPSLEHREYAPNHLWNLMRLVDVLETLDCVDPERIGVAGLSMGGEWTMWLAAMDVRLKAAVVSGWMCTTEGVLSIHNCPCWMPPGLRELCDIADVHILIAPRPLLFESAVSDGCFPIRCTREGYWRVLRGYSLLGAPLNLRQHTFPGGHAWSGGVAYRFIERALED